MPRPSAAQQINDHYIRQLKLLLKAERSMNANLRGQAKEAYEALYEIAERYCNVELDDILRRDKRIVQGWSLDELRKFVTRSLAKRLARERVADQAVELYEKAREDLAQAKQQLAVKDAELSKAQSQLETLEVELQSTRQALADAKRRLAAGEQQIELPVPPESQTTSVPRQGIQSLNLALLGDWFEEWRGSRSFERDRDLVQLLGATGKCLRPELLDQIAESWKVDPKSGSLRGIVSRLESQWELLEILKPKSDRRGNAPHFFRLTERGQKAYLALFGEKARPSQLDELLKRHKNLEHVLLNLEASHMLRTRLNAAVDLYPPRIMLDDGRQFVPDLAATLPDSDETIYVECERHRTNRRQERKWQNIYDGTGGRIYIICPTKQIRSQVTSEINEWAGRHRELILKATDIDSLESRRDKFWFYSRQRG